VAVALSGASADWPARFTLKVLDEIEAAKAAPK